MLHDDFYFEPHDDIQVKSEEGCDRFYHAVHGVTPDHLQRAILATGASAEEIKNYLSR
jgi:hypothetical protein